jgi:hypothetical protein
LILLEFGKIGWDTNQWVRAATCVLFAAAIRIVDYVAGWPRM